MIPPRRSELEQQEPAQDWLHNGTGNYGWLLAPMVGAMADSAMIGNREFGGAGHPLLSTQT